MLIYWTLGRHEEPFRMSLWYDDPLNLMLADWPPHI